MTSRSARLSISLIVAAALAATACSGRDADSPDTADTTAAASTATTESNATTAAGTEPTAAGTTAAATPVAAGSTDVTPPATGEVDEVTWATYREATSIDPAYAFDYPENTVIAAMCESLLVQQPDGVIAPGLATLTRPDPLTMVLTLRDGVTFWDGAPVTPDDVVFSLQRQYDPALGGLRGTAFTRVTSVEATGADEVTIKLSQPDYWLDGALSSMAGVVVEKAFVESQGFAYGTAGGGAMCTGPFKLDSWKPGDRLTVVRNDSYWNGAPLVAKINFVGVPDESTLAAGLLSGDLSGAYNPAVTAFGPLDASEDLTVSHGRSYASAALAISSLDGALGDVQVRNALSMALDRDGLISAVFNDQAESPRALANRGTWGYAPDVFEKAWNALPDPVTDVAGAKAMVEAAGATGKSITLATTNEIAAVATMTNAVKAAAESIGLKVDLQAISAANYINLFIDPAAREGVDGFVTVNYTDFADPAEMYATFVLADGPQNFSGYSNAAVTEALDAARGEADPAVRAQHVADAQALIQQDLPWIPIANPNTTLVTRANLTGAPSSFVYMSAPWAAGLGGKG